MKRKGVKYSQVVYLIIGRLRCLEYFLKYLWTTEQQYRYTYYDDNVYTYHTYRLKRPCCIKFFYGMKTPMYLIYPYIEDT